MLKLGSYFPMDTTQTTKNLFYIKESIMMQQLLEKAYEAEDEYVKEVGQREFDCLIALIEDGTISTEEELSKYL